MAVMTEIGAWLRLNKAALPPRLTLDLIERLGSAEAVLSAPAEQLQQHARITPKQLEKLAEVREDDLARELGLIERLGVTVFTFRDPGYPLNLREIHDPPPVLFIRGKLLPDDQRAVAMVGSRKASPYGRVVAESLARDLARHGITVVSGLALGADSAAHRGALAENGRTIGVLGCGIDICYPASNRDLIEEVAQRGVLMSESPLGAPPEGWRFPARNRILSGLSLGVVVVEAPERSGALITAVHAAEQGREVFAVPGSVNSTQSQGTHQLLKEGAKLVQTVDDILEELKLAPAEVRPRAAEAPHRARAPRAAALPSQPQVAASPPPPTPEPELAGDEGTLLSLLSLSQKYIDQIITESGLPASTVNATLLMLELKGHVRRLPGNVFVRVK